MPQRSRRRFKSSRSRSVPAGCELPQQPLRQCCHVPQGNQHWALAKVFHPPSSAATCLALTVPTGKEKKCLQACSSPQCPPAAGGASAKPLPLALHPVCTQILILVLLFPKRRTKRLPTSDSGQPINQLLISSQSAPLNSPLIDTGLPPVPAVCTKQPPGQIPVKTCGVCPGSARGTGLGQWQPRPCSGSCLVLGGFLAQG